MPLLPLHIWLYRCGRCRASTRIPTLAGDFRYGELTARSTTSSSQIYINALEDDVFGEVADIVKSVLARTEAAVSDRRRGEMTQAVFSLACDPDVDGGRFLIGMGPLCSNCGARGLEEFEGTDEVVHVELPTATHFHWGLLPIASRHELIKAAVLDELSR